MSKVTPFIVLKSVNVKLGLEKGLKEFGLLISD